MIRDSSFENDDMASKKIPVSFLISPKNKEAIDSIAEDEHRSFSQMVDLLLAEAIKARGKQDGK